MNLRTVSLLVLTAASTLWSGCRRPGSSPPAAEGDTVIRGPLSVWTSCEGTLEARRVETIFSRFQGRGTLIEMAPEGTQVKQGDVLARLDGADLENELVKLKNELVRAEAKLDSLENAEIPLEQRDLEVQSKDLQQQRDTERQILADTRELADRKLVSSREIDQEELRLSTLEAKAAQLEQRRALVEAHLYPAKLVQARADVDAALEQVKAAQRQLSNCVVTAPSSGLVVSLPLQIGNEFRTVRTGDPIYPNQPFLCIPDMNDFIVQCFIPESELANVEPHEPAMVTPLAYPDCRLRSEVESLGVMAQPQPGHPLWLKFFRVTIRIVDRDPRLRPGMSLHDEIQSCDRPNALLIPRAAVQWNDDSPSCLVRTANGTLRRSLRLGHGNARWFEVLAGVTAGDRVVLP